MPETIANTRVFDRSIEMYAQARQTLAGGVSSNVRYASTPVPLYFVRGEGACLFDVDGNRCIDYVLGNGPALLGHAPPAVVAAVRDSLADGQVFGAQNPREVALSAALCRLLPNAELVRFASSGTEAVQMAMRLARAFTGRDRIVKFEGHYHGWTDSVSFSVRPPDNLAGPASAPTPVPETPGIAAGVADSLLVASWNSLPVLEALFAEHGGEIAGVLMEPMMVNGGVIPAQPGYLAGVQRLCRQHGALFLCDEVITGFRVGLGGAQQSAGIQPDLSIYAKAISGGFPLAAVAGRREVMELLAQGVLHGGTYNGNVQSMVASLAVLEELTRDHGAVYRRLHENGTALMQGLADLAHRAGLRIRIQGVPSIFQMFFTEDPAPRDWRESARCDQQAAASFAAVLNRHGVRVTPRCVWFLSAAHDAAIVRETLLLAEQAMREFVETRSR